MSRFRNGRRGVVLVATMTLAMGALGSGPAVAQDNVLRYITVEPTQGLDPAIAAADASRQPMSLIYEPLVDYDEAGNLVGHIAESWEASDDLLTWTFKLREGTQFSDGAAITAEDVLFSINRMREGESMGGLLANVADVSISDDGGSIVFSLSAPTNALPLNLSRRGNAAILSQDAVEAFEDYFALPGSTSGPYMLKSFTPKDRAIFVANPNYWLEGSPRTETIEYIFSEDQNSWAAAIESGAADIANVGYADAERLRAGGQVVVEQTDSLNPLFWGWDRTKAPFSDKRVRQAVAHAIDRQGRIDACWFGTGAVTYGNILRPWDPNYVENATYDDSDRDAALARSGELLDEAGWVLADGDVRVAQGVEGVEDGTPLSFEVPYEGNWPAAECATLLLQDTLADVGIDAIPDKYDPAPFWGDVAAGMHTMYHGGAGATNADDLYLNWFHSGGALTALTTHLEDAEIDAQIEAAVAASDAETAAQIYAELEQWQADELPMLVRGYQWTQTALGPGVDGYISRPDGAIRWLANVVVDR